MAPPEGISVSLKLSKTVVSRGEPITMELQVRNNRLTPVENRRGWLEYEFWVEGADGTIWLWSYDPDGATPAVLVHETFAPGEERVRMETWEQQSCTKSGSLTPGRYSARAFWATSDESDGRFENRGWWSDPVQFEIL
jgi:hypothetical protein